MFTKAFNNLKKEGSQSSYNVISNDHDALLDNLRYAKSSDVTKSGVAVAAGVSSLAGGLGLHINNGSVQSLPAFKSFESSYSQSQSMDNFDFELDSMPIKPMSMFSSMPTNLGHTQAQAQAQAQAQEFHIPLKNSNSSNGFNSFNNNTNIQQSNGQGKGGVTKSHSDSKLQNYGWNFPSMVQTQVQETQMQTEAQGPLCDQFGSLKLDNGLGLDVDFGIPPMKTMGQGNEKDSADLGMTSFVPFGSVFARDNRNNNNNGNVQGYNNKFSNIREEDREVIFVPPSKLSQSGLNAERGVRKEDGCFIKPQYYNEYTSCTMAETPIFVLNSVFNLLDRGYGYGFNDSDKFSNNNNNNNNCDNNNSDNNQEADYSRETEVSMNEKDYEINGLVYMKHKQIKFRVSVWHERESNESDLTRIEFLRLKGDKMLFEQFWTEVYELMHTQLQFKDIDSVSPRCTSQEFESLFMPKFEPFKESSDMESDIDTEAAYTYTTETYSTDNDASGSETDSDFTMGNTVSVKDELNNITMDLMQDYREDGIDALADLYDMLDEKEDDDSVYGQNNKNSNDDNNDMITLVATHDILMKILIEKVLSHCDACHVRGGLCVLTKIISLMMMAPQTAAIQQNGAMTASAKVASKESEVWLKRLIEESILLDQLLLLLEKEDLGRILKRHSIRLLSQIFLHYSPIDVNVFNVSKFGRLSNCIKNISLSGDVLRDYTMQQMLKIIENRLVSLQLLSLSEKGNDQAKRASQSLSSLLTY